MLSGRVVVKVSEHVIQAEARGFGGLSVDLEERVPERRGRGLRPQPRSPRAPEVSQISRRMFSYQEDSIMYKRNPYFQTGERGRRGGGPRRAQRQPQPPPAGLGVPEQRAQVRQDEPSPHGASDAVSGSNFASYFRRYPIHIGCEQMQIDGTSLTTG